MIPLITQIDFAYIQSALLAFCGYEGAVFTALWALVVDGAGVLVVARFASFV